MHKTYKPKNSSEPNTEYEYNTDLTTRKYREQHETKIKPKQPVKSKPTLFDKITKYLRRHEPEPVDDMSLYIMINLNDGEQVAAHLHMTGDYVYRPEKLQEAVEKLKTAIEKTGSKIINIRPISKQQYEEFSDKYSQPDSEVIKF